MGQSFGKLVLVRHGQSEWNKKNLFTGWVNVSLSEQGVEEAINTGKKIKAAGIQFDLAFTSQLDRAIKTLWLALEESGQMGIPVTKSWRLNERHYGALQGKNKQETRDEFGDEQVHIWRRSYDITPPALENQEAAPSHYQGLISVPATESLKLTVERVVPFWETEMSSHLIAGRNVIVSAHGNSLRALIKHLEGISEEEIVKLEIGTGQPMLCELGLDQRSRLRIVDRNVL